MYVVCIHIYQAARNDKGPPANNYDPELSLEPFQMSALM